jgi:single-stranded-DNA-specific exonuclease
MNDIIKKLNQLENDLNKAKRYLYDYVKRNKSVIRIFTHLDSDGLSSGAILGKALYRERIPFQITVLKQLEREEIEKISKEVEEYNCFIIFSDFGSGQYKELQTKLSQNIDYSCYIILDHHFPQGVSSKEDLVELNEIYKKTSPWHINPYFYGIDGSYEISGSGMSYLFSKCINPKNIDLSSIAIIGSIGDIQNQGPNKSFTGLNTIILEDAKKADLIEVVNDLNFSSIKPINEAIAYSTDINLPGLTGDPNKTLKFIQTLGIFIEDSNGDIRTLNNITQDEKQKITSAIIEYATVKLNIEPNEIIDKLIVNRYLLKNEKIGSELHDALEFSNLLNACGRTESASLGIAIAMGDRKLAYEKSRENLIGYKELLARSISWIFEHNKIKEKDNIQYFYGEDVIPESVVGTITSMLVFDKSNRIDKSKPIFGLAKREKENVYKVSARANEILVNKGLNLSNVIREACKLTNLDVLGGGHAPAAGTKVPIKEAEFFLDNCNNIIRKFYKESLN